MRHCYTTTIWQNPPSLHICTHSRKQMTPQTICIHTLSHLSHTPNNNNPAMQREPGCAGVYLLCRCVWTVECSVQVLPLKSSAAEDLRPCEKTYLMSSPSAALRGCWWCAVILCTCTHAHFSSYFPCRVTCTSLMN